MSAWSHGETNMIQNRAWLYDLLFVLVLILAGILRLTGVDWGEGHHQHPDELFLIDRKSVV